MQEHLYRFRRHKKFRSIIYQHLTKHNHHIKFLKVQPLEIVEKIPGQSKREFVRSRKECELSWIKKLQTAYPLGLNDNIMGQGNISKTSAIDIMHLVSKKLRRRRSHGIRINRNKRAQHRTSVSLRDLLYIFKNNGRHNLLCKLCSIPIPKLYSIFTECDTISYFSPLYEGARIIEAFCYHKLFPRIDKPEDHKKYFLKIKFINSGIDHINLSGIFRNPDIQKLVPPYFDNTEPPILSYTYKKPSRNVIFNYNSVTSDLDIESNYPTS